MIMIDSHDLMVPGDEFEMRHCDWFRILHPPMGPTAFANGGRLIRCKVLKAFIRSSREVRYLCSGEEEPERTFILGQILEPAYQVSASHPSLQVSALVITEAAARIGVRSITPERPTLYTKDDAERLSQAIADTPVRERYGYLVPAYQ